MITASIVLYNTREIDLKQIIECALNSTIDFIFIIDNSNVDFLRSIIDNYKSTKLKYQFGQGNIGYGKAHNYALTEALKFDSKYHIILNPDISFAKLAIENITNFMDNHSDIGYLLPNVIYPNGQEQYLCKLLPTPIDILGRKIFPKSINERRNYRFEMRATGYNRIRSVPVLSGCFMFLRMDVIKQVGMFDDRFFMYFEDFDLIRRVHRVSKTVFYPEVTIVHNHAAEHRTNKKLLRVSLQSAIKYFNKWGWFFDTERWRVNRHAFDEENVIID